MSLLLYKPRGFKVPATIKGSQISPYFTHILYPQLYNGAQREEPFELIVTQEGINDIVARANWPMENDGVAYLTPEVFLKSGQIELVGPVIARGLNLLVTIVGKPAIDENGLLNIDMAKIKIGAMNITILAKIIAERMYKHHLGTEVIDTDDIRAKIAGPLLNNEPFEPVFPINGKKVRLKNIDITEGKVTLQFIPHFEKIAVPYKLNPKK